MLTKMLGALGEGARQLAMAPRGNIPGLDALRSLAILLVISGHYCSRFAETSDEPMKIWKLPLFSFGWTGVDLFFVLSGYLIGRQLWRELAETNTIAVGRFLLRRGLRIWPFYFAFAFWAMTVSSAAAAEFWPDLLFLSNYFKHQVSGGWSLSTEEHFYIFVPLLLLGTRNVVPLQRQCVIVIALFLLLPVFRHFWLIASPNEGFDAIYYPFHTHSDGLVVGLLISWLSVAAPTSMASVRLRINILVPVTAIVLGGALYLIDRLLFGFSALGIVYGSMVIFVLRDRTIISLILSASLFRFISRLSYGMYLNHFPILLFGMPILAEYFGRGGGGYLGFWLGGFAILCVSFAVSAVTYILIESPFLRLRDRWLSTEVSQAKGA